MLLLLAAALALADASVVTLALPPIIDELDTSVEGAAAVLGVYTLVLALFSILLLIAIEYFKHREIKEAGR